MARFLNLPYIFEDPGRERPFTGEMEEAALLLLADSRRRKPTIFMGKPEDIGFISKLGYPLWAIPWDSRCVIVDGLNLASSKAVYTRIPDVRVFTEDLKGNRTSLSGYFKALERHKQTFSEFTPSLEVKLEAIIGERVLSEVASIIKHGIDVMRRWSRTGEKEVEVIPIPPMIDVNEAIKKVKTLTDVWRRAKSNIAALRYAAKVLEEEKEHHKGKLRREISQIEDSYKLRIDQLKVQVERRVKELTKERENETGKIKSESERRLRSLLREEERLERGIRNAEESLGRYMRSKRSLKRRGTKRESYLNAKITEYKSRISSLRKGLEDVRRTIRKTRLEAERRIQAVERRYQGAIEQEALKLRRAEASMRRLVNEKLEEIRKLEESVKKINLQIRGLMERVNRDIEVVNAKIMPWRIREPVGIRLPFYLVQYKSQKGERYKAYPPMMVEGVRGFAKRISRALLSFTLESRITKLIHPVSEVLDKELFERFGKALESNQPLREASRRCGMEHNLLESDTFRQDIIRGLEMLRDEGWIDDREINTIIERYA